MRRLLVALIATMGCTPAQLALWHEWHTSDPKNAENYAMRPDIQAELGVGTLPELTPGTLPVVAIRGIWDRLAACESGERWSYNGPSGYDGGLQFAPSTWRAMGGTDYAPFAWQASREQQIAVAERLLDVQGWSAWPTCSRRLGLR